MAATKAALRLGDYVVTEAGFGADLGAEKFLDIKCRRAGLRPDAVVIVATVRALKLHGGADKTQLATEDTAALRRGIPNLLRHIENITQVYGLPAVVALNRFTSDTAAELALVQEACAAYGAQRLALDLERLMMDFPLPCPSGEGIRLSREELAIRMQGRSVFYAEDLCARYFTYRRGGQTHFVLFDDAGTLKRKMEMGQVLGIREGFVMLPEVEDLTGFLFTGEG